MGDIADWTTENGIEGMCEFDPYDRDGYETDALDWIEDPKTGAAICPECESPYIERKGRYGAFMGCPNFPKCPGGRTFSKEK
jgi:hypothetical protein